MPSTTFYSTKRNANVNVPNNKVCGYRIANTIMKKGYSDGVRAGKDNGVINQGLSRFSTERQREDAGSSCAGNVNWLNHKTGDTFNRPESAKHKFTIGRKAFDAGAEYVERVPAQCIRGINHRRGQGNREMIRPSFMSPTSHGRLPVDFDKLQAMDIAEFGQKVQLGKEQLSQLTMVAIPDPQDTQWINERMRLMRIYRSNGMSDDQIRQELENNKPLGREQRTNNVPSKNIAREQGLSFNSKLTEIKQEIDNGRAENRTRQAELIGQMSAMLQNQDIVARLNSKDLRRINENLMRLKVPRNYQALFPGRRVIAGGSGAEGQFFNSNKGMIIMFLMSNIPSGRTPNEPLLSWHMGRSRYEPAGIQQIFKMGDMRFLDMEERTIDTEESLLEKGLDPPDPPDLADIGDDLI
jgi:hypothetical protein